MNTIVVNDVKIDIYNYEEIQTENVELKEFSFAFKVQGKNIYYMMKNLFKEKNKVFIPETKTEFVAKVKTSSSQYKGDEMTDATIVNMYYTLSIINEDEEDDLSSDDMLNKTTVFTILNRLDNTALIELLIEKEIITAEEFDKKIKFVTERDSNMLVKETTGYDPEEQK
ncbi:hypothetical protein [Bacillus cereus group sp. BfR-BA-01355]|uniref:hypothetical protein n=1 Tax=Bacillus cereus group sp. BfR-BA-01355 TaxID=2920318 RepID=UPI001F586FA1|nr:hypothetical protein [Bacillus cereus group sp. BfR-BA-01355]